jgi:hypothetical protein
LGFSETDLKGFGARLLPVAKQVIREDEQMSPNDEKALSILADRLGVSHKDVSRTLEDLSRYRLFYDIGQGNIPSVSVPGLILHKGEVAYWSEPGAIIEDRVVKQEYVGESSGMSFRLAKAVSYRTGGFHGHIETEKEAVPASRGSLILTNQRIIFHGDNQSFDAPWQQMLAIDFFRNGLRLSRSGHMKNTFIRFERTDNVDVIGKLISHIINDT